MQCHKCTAPMHLMSKFQLEGRSRIYSFVPAIPYSCYLGGGHRQAVNEQLTIIPHCIASRRSALSILQFPDQDDEEISIAILVSTSLAKRCLKQINKCPLREAEVVQHPFLGFHQD